MLFYFKNKEIDIFWILQKSDGEVLNYQSKTGASVTRTAGASVTRTAGSVNRDISSRHTITNFIPAASTKSRNSTKSGTGRDH